MVQLSLARKAFLSTLLAVLMMAASVQTINQVFVLREIKNVEREDLSRRTERLHHSLDLFREDFAARGKDWANWDDLYEFTRGNNPQFATYNLSYDALFPVDWDIIAILDNQQRLVWGGRLDPLKKRVVPLSNTFHTLLQSKRFRATDDPRSYVSSLIVDNNENFLVAARVIHKTIPGTEAPVGQFVYAQTLNDEWLTRVREVTSSKVDLISLSKPARDHFEEQARQQLIVSPSETVVSFVSDDEARGYTTLFDFEGKPRILLELRTERNLLISGKRVLNATLYAVAIGGLCVLLAAMFVVRKGLIAPIRKLRNAVRNLEQGKHSAVILNRNDELGELASGFNRMARTIRERETTLRQAHAELKLILDSTADALCGCTLTGEFRGSPSAKGPEWFGEPQVDQDVASWLFGNQPSLVTLFRQGLTQVVEDKLPLNVALDQLPKHIRRSNRNYAISYQPIREGSDTIALLLVIKDVTAEVRADQADREARELQIVLGNMLRDKPAFDHFVDECEGVLRQMHTETSLTERLVHLHTLKGASSIFGLLSFSEACQQLEVEIALNSEAMNEEALRNLRRVFRSTLSRVKRFAPSLGDERLSISISDYSNFVELLEKRLGHERLLAEAMRLPLESGERLLGKLVQHAHQIAQELNKPVEIEIDDGGLRLVAESTQLLWASLVHGVRNAIEHGIEPEEERIARGKTPVGNLRFVMREQGQHLAVSIIDDGRGIDWETLRQRAYACRLPSSREDLVEQLFTDGLSTKTQTSSISGRGIGLSAIRATCHALGGTCIVYEGPDGIGTELFCTISMAVATHPSSGARNANSHSRLTASSRPPSADESPLSVPHPSRRHAE
jgi:two-component system chemotaxis sensor kinase CheA